MAADATSSPERVLPGLARAHEEHPQVVALRLGAPLAARVLDAEGVVGEPVDDDGVTAEASGTLEGRRVAAGEHVVTFAQVLLGPLQVLALEVGAAQAQVAH